MKPKIRGQHSWIADKWGWYVDWVNEVPTGKYPVTTFFWTWEAAMDFAVERAIHGLKRNHLHLWF